MIGSLRSVGYTVQSVVRDSLWSVAVSARSCYSSFSTFTFSQLFSASS